jgi:hypothetical protein
MSKFDFDNFLKRRIEQAEARRARDKPPPQPPLRASIDPARPSLYSNISAWIAAATRKLGLVVRVVVDHAPSDIPPPLTVQRPDDEPPSTPRQHVAAPVAAPVDRFGYEAMTVLQLYDASRRPMPGAQRLQLEATLNRKKREQREGRTDLSPEEHERLSRWH